MAATRNDLCPCGSGKKYKKCCLGAPDPKAVRRSRVLLYGALALTLATLAAVFVAGQGVGAAVGLGSFVLLIGYALAGSSAPAAPKAPPRVARPAKGAKATSSARPRS